MKNRVFFPQEAMDVWVADDHVDFDGDELVLTSESRKYRTVEAVRILREVTDGADPNELLGKVKSKAYLAELGAEIMEGSMIMGDNAYDIVQGFVGAPASSIDEHRKLFPDAPATDDEVLAAFIAKAP